jgi:hypothetical protein
MHQTTKREEGDKKTERVRDYRAPSFLFLFPSRFFFFFFYVMFPRMHCCCSLPQDALLLLSA